MPALLSLAKWRRFSVIGLILVREQLSRQLGADLSISPLCRARGSRAARLKERLFDERGWLSLVSRQRDPLALQGGRPKLRDRSGAGGLQATPKFRLGLGLNSSEANCSKTIEDEHERRNGTGRPACISRVNRPFSRIEFRG